MGSFFKKGDPMDLKPYTVMIVGALFLALYNVIAKKSLVRWKGKEGLFNTCVGLIAVVFLVLCTGLEVPKEAKEFWFAMIASGVLNIGIFYFNTKAKSISDVSLVVPISASTPTIVIVTSMIMLGEHVSSIGWLGIMLTAIGTYIFNIQSYVDKRRSENHKPSWRDYLAPFLMLGKDRGVQFAFLAVLLSSLSLNYDGLVARNAPTIGFGFAGVFLISALGNLLIAIKDREWKTKSQGKLSWKDVLFPGILYGAALWLVSAPLQWALVPYAGALKRVQIPMTIILAWIILGEKTSFRERLIGGTIMGAGAALLVFA